MMLHPQSLLLGGRDVVDIHKQTKCNCVVNVCGSKRCKTCKLVHECSTFRTNVTHKRLITYS